VTSQSRQESAVIAGQADLAVLDWNDQSLAIQYPARVHFGLKLNTYYVFLNTRQPPFTNVKARKAISYAIDRDRILQFLKFAPGQAAVTCQMLPADFPGHQPYCPYTSGTKDGGWRGPDMETARRLVRESRTANVPVTVWSLNGPTYTAAGSYRVQLLIELGYQASLHTVSPDRIYDDLGNPRIKIQMGFGIGFGADFPAPSTFIDPLLSCHMADMHDSNSAEFCDPRVDALASQARAAQPSDPAAARRLWAQVDRIVTDQAP
jgi:peptide/nickel transport system substrate-binding protein